MSELMDDSTHMDEVDAETWEEHYGPSLTPEQELEIARETAEYCQQRLQRARDEATLWRTALERQQFKIAGLIKAVHR